LTLSEEAPDAAGFGPAFAEPWQARAFALAVLASKQGCFTWSEWSQALGRELRQAAPAEAPGGAPARGGAPAPGYFDCWLAALQSLLVIGGAVGQDELGARKRAWEDAYRRTPHGKPVSLSDP
jgi:nitrile hydratase accessory protein